MVVLLAKDQHTSGFLLPFLLLRENEISPPKAVEIHIKTLTPILVKVVEAKAVKQIVLILPSFPLPSLFFIVIQNFWQWPYPNLEIQRRRMENNVSYYRHFIHYGSLAAEQSVKRREGFKSKG